MSPIIAFMHQLYTSGFSNWIPTKKEGCMNSWTGVCVGGGVGGERALFLGKEMADIGGRAQEWTHPPRFKVAGLKLDKIQRGDSPKIKS